MSTGDWEFDGADPDVGIFGESVVHTCDENVEDVQDAFALTTRAYDELATDTVAIITTWMCPACQSTTTTTDTQPRAYFEEPRP